MHICSEISYTRFKGTNYKVSTIGLKPSVELTPLNGLTSKYILLLYISHILFVLDVHYLFH